MSFIAGLVKRFRRLASGLKEKPTAQLEEFEFEHFLFYHGLVGSSPENEKSFREVRADINEAVRNNSPVQLSIALKLPPLWWDDKLETIFLEMAATTGNTGLDCLLPSTLEQMPVDDARPLRHSDWRVRSNAARVCAALNATAALPEMVLALRDESSERRAAFCHIAYSLGRVGGEEARLVIKEFLFHEQSWFRVDAAGALAYWPAAIIAHDLMTAMLENHRLSDYAAVAVARKHKPRVFMEHTDETVQDGGVEMVINLLEAVRNTFPPETAYELGVAHSLPTICELARKKPTPRRLRAAMQLSTFLAYNDQISMTERDETIALLENSVQKSVSEWLSSANPNKATTPGYRGEILHAIWLAGEGNQTDALPYVVPMLSPGNPWLRSAIETAGKLGNAQVAPDLVALAKQTVSPEERAGRETSKQPVFEDDEEGAKTYWQIIKALGMLPSTQSYQLLLTAARDFTPDKRAEAMQSLNRLMLDPQFTDRRNEFQNAVLERLSDPAVSVRIAALDAAGVHNLVDLLPQTIKLVESKEVSVYKQAMNTLVQYGNFDARRVKNAVTARTTQVDRFKRERFDAVLSKLPPD